MTEDLNPLIAFPKEDPISGNFLAPKIRRSIANIINNSGRPKGPILIFFLCKVYDYRILPELIYPNKYGLLGAGQIRTYVLNFGVCEVV